MATNRDLLKEAIADAKTVKETAIANAKAALEESFGPFLREKLAAKLSEMEETDEELYEMEKEETYEVEEKKPMEEMGYSEEMENEELSLDELLAELSLEEEQLDEAKEKSEEKTKKKKTDEAKGEEEEMSIEDMTEEDLKSFIEGVIKDMVAAGELEAAEGGEGEEMEMDMEMGDEEGEEDDVNIDELLSEIEKDEDLKEYAETTPEEMLMHICKDYPNHEACKSLKKEEKMKKEINEISNEDILNMSPYEQEKAILKLSADEYKSFCDENPDNYFCLHESKKMKVESAAEMSASEYAEFCKKNPNFPACLSETKKMEKELQELRSELQEINLLNAKLLYTNKLFRNKSLTESQKVKVLAAFDKAKNKQEAQLIYETLLGSIVTTAKSPIKESLGSASKVLGSVAKPIIENDAFARMRELAGLTKK